MKTSTRVTRARTATPWLCLLLLGISLAVVNVNGFSRASISHVSNNNRAKSSPSSLSAGFGGGGAASAKNSKKDKAKRNSVDAKLKPKQQWDRFRELKDESAVAVAVRVEGTDEWLGVGAVRSRGSRRTPQAVFRQRALIAEHARRLHPGRLAGAEGRRLQWGYRAPGAGGEEGKGEVQWAIVDRSCMEDVDAGGLAKSVGFKGQPDPATGFYVESVGGRMDASALAQHGGAGGGGPITGSKKKGPGDGVI